MKMLKLEHFALCCGLTWLTHCHHKRHSVGQFHAILNRMRLFMVFIFCSRFFSLDSHRRLCFFFCVECSSVSISFCRATKFWTIFAHTFNYSFNSTLISSHLTFSISLCHSAHFRMKNCNFEQIFINYMGWCHFVLRHFICRCSKVYSKEWRRCKCDGKQSLDSLDKLYIVSALVSLQLRSNYK